MSQTVTTIAGQTYQHRDAIRRLAPSARWDSARKVWIVSGGATEAQVQALVALGLDVQTTSNGAVTRHTVQTPRGAIIQSEYTQAERAAMRRAGIDTDADDHDLI